MQQIPDPSFPPAVRTARAAGADPAARAEPHPLTVVLLGEPVAWARTRIGAHGLFTPPKQRNTAAALRMAAQDAMQRLGIATYAEPVAVTLLAEFRIPASWPKKKRAAALLGMVRPGRPDIDNLWKLVGDAFNHLVFTDDALVAELHAMKRYGLEPKIVATVRPVLVRAATPAELPLAGAAA